MTLRDVNRLSNNALHECPFDKLEFYNYSVSSGYLSNCPKGDFVVTFKLYEDFDPEGNELKSLLFFYKKNLMVSVHGTQVSPISTKSA